MEEFLSMNHIGYDNDELPTRMVHFPPTELPKMLVFESRSDPTVLQSSFSKLPLEIAHQILSEMDLKALMTFKNISSTTLAIVNSLPAFRDVIWNAPGVLRALGAAKLLPSFTVAQVATVLYTDRCTNCKDFGPFLFLPTCERCCYYCLADWPHVLKFRVGMTKKPQEYYGLSREQIRTLPKMTLIPGRYGPEFWDDGPNTRHHLPMPLVSLSAISSVKKSLGHTVNPQKLGQFRRMNGLNHDKFAFVSSTSMPSYDPRSKVMQSGIWCRGCVFNKARYHAYSMDEFLRHQMTCRNIVAKTAYDSEGHSKTEYSLRNIHLAMSTRGRP